MSKKDTDFIKTIVKDTKTAFKKSNKAIHEDVFKNYFLPTFSGEVAANDDGAMIAKWIELAGGPYRPVDLLDNNNNIVGQVPSLLLRKNGDKRNSEINLPNVINRFKKLERVSNTRGDNFLTETLNTIPKDEQKDNPWDKFKDKKTTKETKEDLGSYLEY